MLETNLINFNFVLLFFLTLFYWLKALDFLPSINTKERTDVWLNLGQIGIIISQTFQMGFLSFRWFTSGHFPLSNLYESLLFLSWVLTFLLVLVNHFQPTLSVNVAVSLRTALIGSIMMPIILLVNTFALFSLPNELKETTALVPALQSNWLVMHVTVMILSYGTLIAGCLFSMAYLVLTFFMPNQKPLQTEGASILSSYKTPKTLDVPQLSLLKTHVDMTETTGTVLEYKPNEFLKNQESKDFINQELLNQLTSLLDNLSYRILGFGFPLLTIGLLSGSIWANQTWGSYWSWDPKETWALITWFIFAMYLHTRFSKGWGGRKSALLATFGFFVLWICYLGVNLMGKGLHSYGFLN